MAKKKNPGFLVRKAEILRGLGITATPISEMVVVDIDYNESQVKALAEGKGLSLEDFMADIDKLSKGDEDILVPGSQPIHSRDLRKEKRDPSVSKSKEEVVEETDPVAEDLDEEADEKESTESKEPKED